MTVSRDFAEHADYARQMDSADPLAGFRERFHMPVIDGVEVRYFCGNSLGLEPRATRGAVQRELDDWATLGVEGHFKAQHPWFSYHRMFAEPLAELVGALPHEVVCMNTLTVNLHLLMTSFYRPHGSRTKILIA
ncbi:MAG: kynureninase, partial [Candidatus Kapabacteria bacterium]|nr:kynureninase [Candidatus Kapabacteria bacterium]